MLTTIPACSSGPSRPENSDLITEGLLRAVNDESYSRYRSYFSEEAQADLQNKTNWESDIAQIKDILGTYEADTLKYQGIGTDDSRLVVYYQAKFSKDTDVTVRLVFQETNGSYGLVGFWLTR